MELMHDFVRGCVYRTSGRYTFSRGAGYFVCDARVKWMTKHYKLNTLGSHKASIRAVLTIETLAWSSLWCFEKLIFKI